MFGLYELLFQLKLEQLKLMAIFGIMFVCFYMSLVCNSLYPTFNILSYFARISICKCKDCFWKTTIEKNDATAECHKAQVKPKQSKIINSLTHPHWSVCTAK